MIDDTSPDKISQARDVVFRNEKFHVIIIVIVIVNASLLGQGLMFVMAVCVMASRHQLVVRDMTRHITPSACGP